MTMLIKFIVCFIAGIGAGLGTGFAGMSAAAVISPEKRRRASAMPANLARKKTTRPTGLLSTTVAVPRRMSRLRA